MYMLCRLQTFRPRNILNDVVYACTTVCVYVHVASCMHVCPHLYSCVHVHAYVCMHVYMQLVLMYVSVRLNQSHLRCRKRGAQGATADAAD